MSSYIQNAAELTAHGRTDLRQAAVDIVEHSLLAADPYYAALNFVRRQGSILRIGDLRLDMDQFERILVIGAGKATYPVARALDEILGNRITDGLVVLKKGSGGSLKHIRVRYGAHPIPDEDGHAAAKELLALGQTCTERDLVLAAITGGSSALLPLPVEEVSLADKQQVNRLLLFSGAEITQINAVRKHLSRIKGGWLAEAILPAMLVNLTVSDVIGDPLDYITDPTVADTSTFSDARKVMDDFDLWDKFPPAASAYLKNGGQAQETPHSFSGMPLFSFILVGSDVACLAAARRSRELGYTPLILTTTLKGEAREAGSVLASIACEAARLGRPLQPPCAILAAGENTVTINGACGAGGPNQEFAAAAAIEISGQPGIVVVSMDTDGTDGPTDLAGAIVDGSSLPRARKSGLDLGQALRNHNVAPVLQILGESILTGHTGTNINDLKVILVSPNPPVI